MAGGWNFGRVRGHSGTDFKHRKAFKKIKALQRLDLSGPFQVSCVQ